MIQFPEHSLTWLFIFSAPAAGLFYGFMKRNHISGWPALPKFLQSGMPDKKRMMLASGSGLLLTASFPNIELSALAWLALFPLLMAIRDRRGRETFWIGFAAGLVHNLSLIYWIAYTMRTYGYLPVILCVLVLLLLASVMAMYWGCFTLLAAHLPGRPFLHLLIFPALWAGLEYLRSFFLSGFPWELVGYSQFRYLKLIQIADILGPFGVSYVIVLTNVAIFMVYLHLRHLRWQGIQITRKTAIGSASVCILIIGLTWIYGAWRIPAIERQVSSRNTLRVAVIQGNIEQDLKWDPDHQLVTLKKYFDISESVKRREPDLIVWPETAAPFYFGYDEKLTALLQERIRQVNTLFLIGIPSVQMDGDRIDYYNTALLLDGKGQPLSSTHKAHLVPFGEYVPLRRFLPFLGKMVAQVGDFTPGRVGDTIQWNGHRLGVLICYEMIFPYLARAMVANGAQMMVNITNDAWYGRTGAPHQHFSMAVFRAVENRRYMVRAANTGVSGFIDPVGRILATTPLFEDAAITGDIALMDQVGWYTQHGDLFGRLCLGGVIIASGWILWRRKKSRDS